MNDRLDANINATGGLILLLILLLAIGWLGDKSGAIDALGLRPDPSPSSSPKPRTR